MAAGTALKKITARVKALKKKHPGAKYKTLQKQAGREFKAGKLKAKRKAAPKRKPAKRKVARRKVSAVGAVRRKRVTRRKAPRRKKVARAKIIVIGAPKRKRRRAVRRKAAAPRRRRIGSSGTNTALIVGGLAIAGIAAYLLLKPSTPQYAYVPTGNATRDAQANNILSYAAAAGMGISAITSLINALSSKSNAEVAQMDQAAKNAQQYGGSSNDLWNSWGISGIGCIDNGVGALTRQIG